MTDHLDRYWLVCCCKDGTLTIRPRYAKPFNNAALPIWSCDTATEAEAIVRKVGRRVVNGKGEHQEHPHKNMRGAEWWVLQGNYLELEIDDLPKISEWVGNNARTIANEIAS